MAKCIAKMQLDTILKNPPILFDSETEIVLSDNDYDSLCKCLKRKVRRYKGHSIIPFSKY